MAYNRYLNNVIRTAHLQADSVTNAKTDGNQPKHLEFLYDFTSAQGGTAGAIVLTAADGTAQQIPGNSIVMSFNAHVEVPVTSGGSATVALGIVGDTDCFVGATAKGSLGLNVVLGNSNGTGLPVHVLAPTNVLATIGTADLTAGKIKVFVSYIEV